MNNTRPAAFFAVGGTDVTLLNRPNEAEVWVKTRRTVSLPLWQHQIGLVERVNPASITYQADLQHFRIQASGAVNLAWYIEQQGPLPQARLLPLAAGLLDLLDQWHRQGVAVLSLTPQHLLYRPQSNECWLADWSLALPYTDATFDALSNHITDEVAPYASPEQTGKTDLPVDYRSDYFTFGVVLYRMATGHLPFDAPDNASLIYRILTVEPEPAHRLNPSLSAGFGAVLAKLLAKNPADRYQSIDGLRHDLTQLAQTNFDPTTFRPGQTDSQSEFVARPVLVGRQTVLESVTAFIESTNQQHQKGIALLIGSSGSGKTALLHNLETRLFTDHYVLLSDLSNDQVQPYSALRTAINELADRLLGQDWAVQDDFRFHLDAQIGPVLSVLTDFSPEMQKLTGTQTTTPSALAGSANQDRLAYVIAGFLRALVLTGRPVVWLVDNLHASSDASLRLLNALSREALLTQLTLVGATNRREADLTTSNERIHAFVEGIEALDDSTTSVQTVGDLSEADLGDWLLNLHIAPNQVADVAAIIHQKTGGNPFSVQQLMQQLSKQRAVSKPEGAYFFRIDTDILATYQASDNLLNYLTGQIDQLPPNARQLFDMAVCFRQPFQDDELAALTQQPVGVVRHQLDTLLAVGMIVPRSGAVSAERAYVLAIPQLMTVGRQRLFPATRQTLMAQSAAYLLAHNDLSQTDQLFQLVTTVLELPPELGEPFTDYLLLAGQEAATLGATELSSRCYAYLTDSFTEADWQFRFDECFATYIHYLRTVAYAEDKHNLLEDLTGLMRQKARHKEDLAVIVYQYGMGLLHHNRGEETIQATLPVLHLFGIDIPLEPSQFAIIGHSIRAGLLLRNKTTEQIENLPDTTDPNARIVINMLSNISLASALVRPKMIPVLMYHQLRSSMQFGLMAESGAGFLMYAVVQAAYQGGYQTAADMIDLALRLSRRFDAIRMELSCQLVKGIYIHHWVAPYQESIDLLLDTYRQSRENGLLTNAFNALGTASFMSVFSQLPLEVVFQRGLDSLKLVNTQNQSLPQILCRVACQISYDLRQAQAPARFLTGEYAHVDELEPYLRQSNEVAVLSSLLAQKLFWAVHLHQPESLSVFEEFCSLLKTLGEGLYSVPVGYFYGGLLCLQQPGPLSSRQKRLTQLAISRLKAFSKVYAGNNQSRYYLLKGQYLIRTGNASAGLLLLDQAIETAARYGQLVEQALAHESKGRYYLTLNQPSLGQRELADAISLYGNWGAWAIINRLKDEFPFMKPVLTQPNRPNEVGKEDSTGQIDLISFLKNSATISSKLKLGDLLTNLLGVVLENAGAQKAALLVNQNGTLRVFALKETNAPISLDVQLLSEANLPQNPIRYATRTAKPLVLTQAYTDRVFSADAYFRRYRTLSVLVMPVVTNEQLLAVIYLENNSTPGAFSSRRLEVLQLLSSQIAISLENAMLYDDMEGRVQERTVQLQQEMDTSETLLLNILPKSVAEELKLTGRAAARQFDDITVMFTDFVNFTRIAEQMEPEALVAELDFCFGEFDRITDRYGLEKIKTIGDAYLCTGGLPDGKPNHTADVVRAALAISQFITDRRKNREADGKLFFEIRIGIHNGPLVAGVVGTRKFAYDIWGDTVNTAARMEQSSEPGRVNVSGRTWAAIEGQFSGQYRGQVKAKNKGAIDMYFVDSVLNLPIS